jgi:hypothetical protein
MYYSHILDSLYKLGYVCSSFPNGVSVADRNLELYLRDSVHLPGEGSGASTLLLTPDAEGDFPAMVITHYPLYFSVYAKLDGLNIYTTQRNQDGSFSTITITSDFQAEHEFLLSLINTIVNTHLAAEATLG